MKVSTSVVMTVHTGVLLCPIDSVYKFLEAATGSPVFTHQIPRVIRELQPVLLKQHPRLADFTFMEGGDVQRFLELAEATLGGELEIEVPVSAVTQIDPISEAAEFFHPDKIIPVVQ
jgi:hypothetical protein